MTRHRDIRIIVYTLSPTTVQRKVVDLDEVAGESWCDTLRRGALALEREVVPNLYVTDEEVREVIARRAVKEAV